MNPSLLKVAYFGGASKWYILGGSLTVQWVPMFTLLVSSHYPFLISATASLTVWPSTGALIFFKCCMAMPMA